MNDTTSATEARLRRHCAPLLLAAALVLTGCGSEDDTADNDEPAVLTDVQPVGAARSPHPPEVPLPPDDGAQPGPAIDGDAAPGESTQPVERQIYATAKIVAASGSDVRGELRFHQDGDRVRIQGSVQGLEPGEHGLHIHTVGDCSAPDAASAMGHFAPDGDPHGSPDEPAGRHHVGDLGNITTNQSGLAEIDKTDAEMTLQTGEKSIVGRAVIVHAGADDLVSQPSGAAGARVGCGIIEIDVSAAYQPAADDDI